MSHKDDPRCLKYGTELADWAVGRGCERRDNGRHTYVTAPNGQGVPIPTSHREELPRGTRRSILKSFVRMGLLLTLAGIALALVVQYLAL